MKSVLTFLLTAAALCSCHKQTVTPQKPATAASPVAQGQIVAVEPTRLIAAPNVAPVRWRWRIELAPPLTLPGSPNSSIPGYSQVKAFSLTVADTAVFRRGTRISFAYQALPWSPPQWYSTPEALSMAPVPPHFELTEVTLSNVQAL